MKHTLKVWILLFCFAIISFLFGAVASPLIYSEFQRETSGIQSGIITDTLRNIGKSIRKTPETPNTVAPVKSGDIPIDMKLFSEAYKQVSDNYYGFDSISEKDLVAGMIKGFVDALGDKHSEYFNLDETKKFNETLSGDFEGIGAVIEKNDFGVAVGRIIAGSPAKDVGILSGDIITKANGEELKGLNLNDAVAKIRGPAGTKVELEIIRPGQKEIINKSVTRQKIQIPSVDGKMIDGANIGYIALSIFGEKTADDFEKILRDLLAKNANGIIIDLRDNGGGYLEAAVSILSNFVEKDKVLVTTKEKNPLLNRSYFSYGSDIKQVPIVLLVNENSASASEITAGALRDYGLAILVGTKTYGKGSVQQPFNLSDGSELKVTIAKWYTPKDYGIDKVGITPDIEVKYEKEDFEKKYDRQLEVAKQVLTDLITKKDRKEIIDAYNKKQEDEKKKVIESGTGKTK